MPAIAIGEHRAAASNVQIYLTLKGQKSGPIEGPVTQKGREKSIQVLGYDYEVMSPRDPMSGLPTGKRLHKPIVIRKRVDQASPLLFQACTTNENISEFTMKFWRPSKTGQEEQFFTIKLTNASVASVKQFTTDNTSDEGINLPYGEEVSFTFQKIEMSEEVAKKMATDDWEAGAGS